MKVNLSSSTLISCRCALRSHIRDLETSVWSASTLEFRTACLDELKLYQSALDDLNKYF